MRAPGRGGGAPPRDGRAGGPRPGVGLAAGLLLLAVPACAGPERSDPPVPEDVYVAVMGRLAAVRTATDPGRVTPPTGEERADSLRRAVLSEYGVDRSELEEFARVVGDEPDRMRALWKRIGSISDSLWRSGWPPLTDDQRVRGGPRRPREPGGGDGGRSGG